MSPYQLTLDIIAIKWGYPSKGFHMKKVGFLIIGLLLSLPAIQLSALEYHSEKVKLMDIEVLQQIISKNIKKLENREESAGPVIKDSLELLLALPDQSMASSGLFDQLRTLSREDKIFAGAMDQIASEAISSLKKEDKDKDLQREQNTYVYILNNMIAELQKLKDIEEYKNLIVKIRDADIDFSDSLISYRLLNSMSTAENPSKYAATVLPKKKSWWKFW